MLFINYFTKYSPLANRLKSDEFEQMERADCVIEGLQGISEIADGTLIVEGVGTHATFVTFMH